MAIKKLDENMEEKVSGGSKIGNVFKEFDFK